MRLLANSCQLQSLEESDLCADIKITFDLCIIFVGQSGKFITFTFLFSCVCDTF
jgi:hypothetical protein